MANLSSFKFRRMRIVEPCADRIHPISTREDHVFVVSSLWRPLFVFPLQGSEICKLPFWVWTPIRPFSDFLSFSRLLSAKNLEFVWWVSLFLSVSELGSLWIKWNCDFLVDLWIFICFCFLLRYELVVRIWVFWEIGVFPS